MPGTTTHDSATSSPMLRPMLEFLRGYPPFSCMQPSHLDFLVKRLHATFYARGESIGRRAALCIVKSGAVLLRQNAGNPQTLGAGALLIPPSFAHDWIVEAAQDSICLELDRESARSLAHLSPEFHQATRTPS